MSSRIQVLHLLGNATHDNTAICKLVETMVQGVDPVRFEHHVWFLGEDGPWKEHMSATGVKVKHVPWRADRRRDIGGAWRFRRAIKTQPFDIIHQHFGSRGLRWIAQTFSTAKIVFHMHLRIAERDGIAPGTIRTDGADSVIAISRAVAASAEGIRPHVIYPGINVPQISRSADHKTNNTIGFVGRLEPVKGLSALIKAMSFVKMFVPDVRLQVAGDGSQRTSLEKYVEQCGVGDIVDFLGHREDIENVMKGWKLLVVPSLEEGFGMAALEAMSLGVPVLARNVSGLTELINDNATGWLFHEDDSISLANRITMLLRDDAKLGIVALAAQHYVSVKFTAPRMCKEIEDIYNSLLGTPVA